MTEVVLHGNLGVKFGKNFKCKISSVREVFDFIDANRPGFSECLKKLSQQGMHYALILDGKKLSDMKEINNKKNIKKIDIVPAVLGKGPIAVGIGSTIATIALSSALAAGTISLTTFIVASVVIAVVSMALQMMLAPKPPEAPSIEATTRALQQSFYFANKANIAEQGNTIPVGYGRLLVSSYVIEACNKNFPQNTRANQIFSNGIKDNYLGGNDKINIDILFPDEEPPPDYRGWGSSVSLSGNSDLYFDPDRNHGGTGPVIFQCWQSPFKSGTSSFAYSVSHPYGFRGLIWALFNRGSSPRLSYAKINQYGGSPTSNWGAKGIAQVPSNGIPFEGVSESVMQNIAGNVQWGNPWGDSQIQQGLVDVAQYNDGGYQDYGKEIKIANGSYSYQLYLVNYFNTSFNPITKEGVIAESVINVSHNVNVIMFDNGWLPRSEPPPNECSTVYYPPCNRIQVYANQGNGGNECTVGSGNIKSGPIFRMGVINAGGLGAQGGEKSTY